MSDESIDLPDLQREILTVYRGSLEEFVSRREVLSKQLRASKRREAADQVRALRKPSRTAWALDNVVYEDAAPVEQLASAIAGAQQAQSRGADLRAALENVRIAVRDVAHAAARAAIRGGQPIESTALVAAVNAVIGDATAFADLRAGRLVGIPDAGGLDFLTAITVAGVPAPASVEASKPPGNQDAEQAALRSDLKRAEAALAEARQRSETVERVVLDAQAKLDAAEQQLRRAQEESAALQADLDRARQREKAAAAEVNEAQQAVTDLRARIHP